MKRTATSAPTAFTLCLVVALRPASALRSGGLQVAEPSYILHKPCPSFEGLGASLKFVKPIIEVALRQNLTYVCQAKDFRSRDHHTGNMGYIFGCLNDSHVVGDMASYDAVKSNPRLNWVNAQISAIDPSLYAPGAVKSEFKEGKQLNLTSGTVYRVEQVGLMYFSWGVAYKWFRSQFHMIRRSSRSRLNAQCWDESRKRHSQNKTIVLAVRRGDSHIKTPTSVFAKILEALFSGKIPGVSAREDHANIIVISESDPENAEFKIFNKKFNRSSVRFFVSEAESAETVAQARLVRDLDCMSLADVLIVSKGGFGSLAAALQKDDGISLSVDTDRKLRPDVPNTVQNSIMETLKKDMRWYSTSPERHTIALQEHYDGLPNSFVVRPYEDAQSVI